VNLYGAFRGDPLGRYDIDGRLSPPFVAFLIATARCGLPYYISASLMFENDKMRHCWASCMIARDCGMGISSAGGLTKEVGDAVIPGRGGWDQKDMQANMDGWSCAGTESVCGLGNIGRWFRQSCLDCCLSKGYTRDNAEP
jgi:hypothetical protein